MTERDIEQEWEKFMIETRKWDSKNMDWKYLMPNQYHNKLKTIEVKIKRDDGSEYTSHQQIFAGWEKGPSLFDYCQLCSKDLKKMRDDGKKVIKFCCKDHSIEYSKRGRIRKEKFGEENTGFVWPTNKGKKVFRENIQVNIHRKDGFKEFPLKAKKSKWK